MSRTMRLMAKPDMEFPNMETTLPKVMMVKSLVHREGVFSADDIFRSDLKKACKKSRTVRPSEIFSGRPVRPYDHCYLRFPVRRLMRSASHDFLPGICILYNPEYSI